MRISHIAPFAVSAALSLALAIVGGIAAGMRCDASEWIDNSSQTYPRVAAYTVKTYTEGSGPFDAMKMKMAVLAKIRLQSQSLESNNYN